uniref:Dopamine receptor D4b n=1 Tax=Kryptolebias marmoratus TaxID=37003 RepID=A0A3Q3FVA2_KRYMA
MDVMLCTASIFNLCAISIDRFIAVSIPLNYNRKHVDYRQLILLSATWLLALAVASPIIFGINNVPDREPSECKLEDNNYVIYSSICSFFIPCPIMVLLYFGVFRGLQRWEEARRAKLHSSIEECRKLQHATMAASLPMLSGTIPGPLPMPLPRIIERDLAQCRMDDSGDYIQQEIPYPRQYRENSVPSVTFSKQQHIKRRAKLNSRERKAMRVLPVVVVNCYVFKTVRLGEDCGKPSGQTHLDCRNKIIYFKIKRNKNKRLMRQQYKTITKIQTVKSTMGGP